MNVLLFIIAIALTAPLFIINLIAAPIVDFTLLKWRTGANNLNQWFKRMAISVDQFGNTSCYRSLNWSMVKSNGYQFGNIDQTASFVLGVNKMNGTLTGFGWFMCLILNKLEPFHVEKAVDQQRMSDRTASKRLSSDFYKSQNNETQNGSAMQKKDSPFVASKKKN